MPLTVLNLWFSDTTECIPLLLPTQENSYHAVEKEHCGSWKLWHWDLTWKRRACPREVQSYQQHQVLRCSGFPCFFNQVVHTWEGRKHIPGKKPHAIKIYFEQRVNNDSLTFASARGLDTSGSEAFSSFYHASVYLKILFFYLVCLLVAKTGDSLLLCSS